MGDVQDLLRADFVPLGLHEMKLMLHGVETGGFWMPVSLECDLRFVTLEDGISCGCEAGMYLPEGGTACRACPAGTFSARGASSCSACGLFDRNMQTSTTDNQFAPNGISCYDMQINGKCRHTLRGHRVLILFACASFTIHWPHITASVSDLFTWHASAQSPAAAFTRCASRLVAQIHYLSCLNPGTLAGYWSERHLSPAVASETRTWRCAPEGEDTVGKLERCRGGMNSSCQHGHDESWALCGKCIQGAPLQRSCDLRCRLTRSTPLSVPSRFHEPDFYLSQIARAPTAAV